MKNFFTTRKSIVFNFVFTVVILSLTYVLNLTMQLFFDTKPLIPMLFVLGTFLISLKTHGYFWGVVASLVSVLLVNYAFTYPYYAIDLISPECVLSAVVMLIVSVMTSTLTTKIKEHEKMKADAEKERMRANLLRAVSHDLRTPLTSVYGSCSAIIDNYDSLEKNTQLKLLNDIKDDSEWLIRMVENLLSVTRIDGEKVEVKKSPIVLEELVDSVLVKFRKRCPDINVFVSIPDELVIIPMDPMLIEQVLLNVLENGAYHAKGMKKLELTVAVDQSHARFTISDDGCGISSDVIKDIFTGYLDRKNTPTDGTRKNLGIGLSVCSAIVKAHGSEIFARNLPEGGAEFCFDLLLEDENEQQ